VDDDALVPLFKRETGKFAERLAALPEVFWLPAAFTPGKLMSAEPLKDTPPMLRAVCRVVAVAALPVEEPEDPETLPVTLPVKFAVIVPAAKLPEVSRATIAEAVLALVAVVAALGIVVDAVMDPVPVPYT
jgi:hypothetical protein